MKYYLQPFENVKKDFRPINHTIEEFESYLKKMGDKDGLGKERIEQLKKEMAENE